MRRKLQLVGLSAMALWRAASDPRCKVKGYFQSTPFIFSCDGSGGDRDTNIAEVYMESRGSQEIVRIPQGTLDFVVSLDSDAEADLIVLDGSDNVVPHMMHSVGNNQWLGHYKGMDISYSASTGSPTSEKLSFSGSPTPELSLRLVSHSTTPSNFRIGYYYFPYADGQGPQCRQGGAPVGCKHYHEASVREAVVGWANWLLTRYADAETAWAKLMIPLAVDSVVPYHHWCSAWNAWPAASSSSVECMEAYKFVTSGGLEAHSTKIFKEQFLWAFSLPAIANFDAQCCGKLRASFKQGSLAWDHIKKVQGQYNLESPLQGLMKVCESVSLAPKSRDYALFLDADGDRPVGNIAAEDISHCWNEDATPLMPTPKPAVASATPMSMPMPTSTPTPTHKPAASPTTTKQVPYSPTPTPTAMTAATPTPTPTPMVPQQSLGQTPTPTPTPTPLPSDLNQYLLPSTSTRPSPYTPFTSTRSSSPRPVSTSSPRPVSTSSSLRHHHQHLVSTTLIAPAHKGATELLVGSHAGFQIGQQIDIDLGKPNHEVATIKSLGRIDLGSGRQLGPHYLGRIDLGSGLHRQHEAGAMITGKAHQTSTPAPHSTARPRAPTPRPIWRVPTVFHYEHIHEHSCSGHSFTNGPEPSCVGWMQVTPQFCQEKCANSQTSPGCPRRPCMAAVFFADGGWCHLYTADQCRHLKSVQGATTYKKESGGGHAKGLPHSGTHGAGHSSASAKPPIGQEAQGLKQKHIPFLVAGIAGGAAAGAALMAGAGIVISSISASKKGQPPAAPQGVSLSNTAGNPLHKPPSVASPSFSARTVNATAATGVPTLPPIANASTTSIPLTMWDQASASLHSGGSLQGGISAGPVLPLACLAVVCLCGLTALIVAAVIDPCQRGGRKRVHRGGDVGGSVASVGSLGDSVASVGSMDSEQAAYYDGYEGYSDQYGNSIASVGTYEGGSVYTYEGGSVGEAPGQYEYDYLPQDAHRPLYNEYGYPSTTPLPQNHQVPDYGSHPASHAGSYGAQRMVYAS